ncbi:MAG: response regulator transcription factor [Bacteroidota bacterium]|nr:response regulator transcription factor [Bacteroidota bacterium]
MGKIKIMLAEDDLNLGSLLEQYLQAKDYETDLFKDGAEALTGFNKKDYDFCIIDVMMPKKDGYELTSDIRKVRPDIPIIFLTAKTLKEDVLKAFEMGADDYITKPFNMQELIFRIEAILRRTAGKQPEKKDFYKIGIFSFDTNKQMLTNGDETKKLTTKESELLQLLCRNMNNVLERNAALKAIWRDDNYFNARSMDVYITKLRKLLKPDDKIQIINIHGKGYKLIVEK